MITRPILLIGSTGQLGWELHRSLLSFRRVIALDYPQVNLAEPESLREIIRHVNPSIIINAAAYTKVDQAENEPDLALAINAIAPAVLAEEANRHSCPLIHYSTDYIFDGTANQPYHEDDQPNPINLYGLTKLEGEKAVQAISRRFLIFRTSWLYSMRRESFVTKVIEWASRSNELRIVDDQVSSPTWARMLAQVTVHIISGFETELADRRGVYHLCAKGHTNRYEWAKAILEIHNEGSPNLTRIIPARSADFPTPAKRPVFSALDCSLVERTFSLCLPDWREMLKLAMVSS